MHYLGGTSFWSISMLLLLFIIYITLFMESARQHHVTSEHFDILDLKLCTAEEKKEIVFTQI